MTNIQVAGSVFLAEVSWIEHAAAGHLRALVWIPIHSMRVGVTCAHGESATVAREPQHSRLISGVGTAEELRDLLVIGIKAPGKARRRMSRRPRRVKRN